MKQLNFCSFRATQPKAALAGASLDAPGNQEIALVARQPALIIPINNSGVEAGFEKKSLEQTERRSSGVTVNHFPPRQSVSLFAILSQLSTEFTLCQDREHIIVEKASSQTTLIIALCFPMFPLHPMFCDVSVKVTQHGRRA